MSLVKLAPVCLLVASCLAACGSSAKPVAGSADVARAPGTHARIDDPRTRHEQCLRQHGLAYTPFRAAGDRYAIQVGTRPSGPTIVFEPTDGVAQGLQIDGQAAAAEVIGASLLYPNGASDAELKIVENCTALGVTG